MTCYFLMKLLIELLKLNETMFLSLLLFSLTEAEHRVGPNGEWDYHGQILNHFLFFDLIIVYVS